MKTRIMSLVLVLLSIPIFAQIQSIQVTDNASHLNVTINGNTRSIPKRDLNLQYVDPNITLSMNGTRIFKIDNHALVTVPTSTNIVDLNNKLIALLQEDTGGGPETDPTVPADVKSLTSADVASFRAAATATTNGSFVTANSATAQTNILGAKTWTGFHTFNGGIFTRAFSIGTGGALGFFNSNQSTSTFLQLNPDGNTHLQAPGAPPTNNGNRLTVDGTTLLNGMVATQDVTPDANNTRNLGTNLINYQTVNSLNFLSNSAAVYGSRTPNGTISFWQGTTSQRVFGYHPNGGGFYVQAPGVVPASNGYMASIYGTLLTTGRGDFTDTWAGSGQIQVGSNGQGGKISLLGGSNGAIGLSIGMNSAVGTVGELRAANSLNLITAGSTRISIGNNGTTDFNGVTNHADVANFTGTWANGQIVAGGAGNGGNIQINRGDASGTAALNIRTLNATSVNSEIRGAGSIDIVTPSSIALNAGSSVGLTLSATNASAGMSFKTGGTTTRLLIDALGVATFTNTVNATQFNVSALNTAPASATATGTTGEIRVTSGFIYVCIATNTWVRSALTTW